MRTVYRIVRADGAPLYMNDRAHVLAKLGTRKYRDRLGTLTIQRGEYESPQTEPAEWVNLGPADNWLRSSN